MGGYGDNGAPPRWNPRKLYVTVRGDLRPGLRAAQAAHAVAEVVHEFPLEAEDWRRGGNFLIVLEVPNEVGVLDTFHQGKAGGIRARYLWREPDLQLDATAVAFLPEPDRNFLFADLPLAYRRRSWLRRWRA